MTEAEGSVAINPGAENREEKKDEKNRGKVQLAGYPSCPDCGAMLIPQEGCMICRCCGYERC